MLYKPVTRNQSSESAFGAESELLSATDAQIDDAVKYADPMTLRGLIYQLTGDEELAELPTNKLRVFLAEAWNLESEEAVQIVQQKAAAFLKAHRDSGAKPIGPGPASRLPRSLALAAGEEIPVEQLDMWIEETAIDPWGRSLKWPAQPTPEQLENFTVAVIGAGMGGLGAAVQLKQAGIKYFVIEKNPGVGGTWHENRYPGARVDTPSRAYTHIFGADFVFDYAFSPQEDNQRYFDWVADKFEIRDNIQFNTEVSTMSWDDQAKLWELKGQGPDGEFSYKANAIICATGLLARPNLPNFSGQETFTGPSFHTARWPEGLDVSGKRVAVIGTGATGYQMVPQLIKDNAKVTLFQRKPQWLFQVKGYLSKLPPQVTWLDRNMPYHINFMRFRTNWLTGEHVYGDVFTVDPEWRHEYSRSALNEEIRQGRVAYIEEKFKDHPELVATMTPPHPPFSARPILVDADYNIYDTLVSGDVNLVPSGVDAITPDGVEAGGISYPADVIVYATGFKANDLLWPMEIRGMDGVRLQDFWAKDGCRAYISGSMVPGFPNFFVLYGPNTNPAVGGGIVNHEEMVTRFALDCIAQLVLTEQKKVDVDRDGFDRYNAHLDKKEVLKIYTDPRAQNFFMNQFMRSSVMCPFAPSELWLMLRDLGPADLIFS